MRNFLTFCFCITSGVALAQLLEAEDGILLGTQVSTQRSGYTGSGYVTGFDVDGDKVTMITDINQGGIYNLYIRYASPSGDKYNFVVVNDVNLGSVQFAGSAIFKETLIGKIYLNKGENTIAIVKEWGYFDLDNFRLEATEPSEIYNISSNLITANPSEESAALYNFLSKVYGKVILSGQYGGDPELNRIQSIAGKKPLVRGFDLIDYSPSRVEHGASSTEIEKAIEWHAQRGIVTFSWHWNAPKDLIDQPGQEWWRGFYTDATTFDVTKAMNDATSEEYTLIIRDIDAIAHQLKKLKDANVPVLWRPLHEAEGAWFWWGAKGSEPCKWLWKLVFERLVNHHQLNNLIWVWTSTASSSALDWYPGNDYADIIGADIYLPAGNYGSNFIMFDNLAWLYQGKKIIALSENGPIPDPERLFVEGAAWNWFCTWSGDFIMDDNSNSTAHINAVYNHEYVITLDELDDVDAIIAAVEEKRTALDEEDEEIILGTEDNSGSFYKYQNPIQNNNLIITSKGIQNISKIVIYDTQGRIEFTRENKEHHDALEFDFTDKGSGMYFVKVHTSSATHFFRVIKS